MISYTLTIGRVTYPMQIGTNIVEDDTEAFDTGEFIVKTTVSEEFEPDTDVIIGYGTKQFSSMIQADRMQRLTSTIYVHNITLVEYTAKLSKTYVTDKFFTVKSNGELYNHYEILDILRDTNPLNKSSLYTIDGATIVALQSKKSPQKKFEGLNMLECVTDIMRGIKSAPRLSRLDVLSHTPYNELGNPISITKLLSEQGEKDFNNYATTIRSQAKNITNDADIESIGVWMPTAGSSGAFTTPRASEGKYDDSIALYELGLPIRRKISAEIEFRLYDGSSFTTYIYDCSDYVVSKDEWDGLDLGSTTMATLYTEIAQRNTIYYEIGGTTIEGLGITYKTASTTTRTHAEMLVRTIANANGHNPAFYIDAIRDLKLRIFYQPYFDADITEERYDDDVTKRSEILNNQKDTTLDIGRYAPILKDIANRMAYNTWLIKHRVYDVDDLYDLKDYTSDGYKIIKRSLELYPSFIDATYELAKNWVTIDGYQTVYRSTDPYTIGRDNVKSNFLYKEYLELSTTERTDTGELLTSYGWNILLNAYDYLSANDDPVRFSILTASGTNQGSLGIGTNCISSGEGVMRFITGYNEPKFVGSQIETGAYDTIIKPIRYTTDSGHMETASIGFATEQGTTSSDTFPLVNYPTSYIMEFNNIDYHKNPNDIWNLNIELHPYTDSPDDIIIGEGFTRYNNLVREFGSTPPIYVYVSYPDTKYDIFDTEIKDLQFAASSSFTVDKTNHYIDVNSTTGASSNTWAMGYYDGTTRHLLFAVNYNQTSRTRIYINNLKERSTTETL